MTNFQLVPLRSFDCKFVLKLKHLLQDKSLEEETKQNLFA